MIVGTGKFLKEHGSFCDSKGAVIDLKVSITSEAEKGHNCGREISTGLH